MSASVWRGVVVSGLVLALAGCGGDGKASPSSSSIELHGGTPVTGPEQTLGVPPTETATAGPGATATAGPPEMPAVAKTNTKEGAEAFAVWYLSSLNYSVQHPEVPPPPVGATGCEPCSKYESAIANLHNNERHYSNEIFVVNSVKSDALGSRRLVTLEITERPYSVLEKDGKINRSKGEKKATYQPDLQWKDGSWKILTIRADLH